MVRYVLLCSLILCVSATTRAAEVHKCATPTGIAYQGVPCSGVELPAPALAENAMQTVPRLQANAASSSASGRTTPDCAEVPQRASPRFPWRYSALCIGMTDDEVLNLAGWGRPAAISRTRAPREWREEWFYDGRTAGTRQLFFVNGKLSAVESDLVEVAAAPTARFASN